MLRRPAENILINSGDLDADLVQVIGGVIYIEGFGSFTPADVNNCYKECPADDTAKVMLVSVDIPAVCECPDAWDLLVVCKPDLMEYETNTTYESSHLYEYHSPDGSALVAATVAAGLVAQINAHTEACVTAVQTDALGVADAAGAYVQLTSKTNAFGITIDFNTYAPKSTSVTTTTAYSRTRLSGYDMLKTFPVKPGFFGHDIKSPSCGTYCKYHFVIRKCCVTDVPSDAFDIDTDRQYFAHEVEVNFYVDNSIAANFETFWDDELAAHIPCIEDGGSGS
jgi:hypothetical protein